MLYNSLRSEMKSRLAELKEQSAQAEDEQDFGAADGLIEKIKSLEWQIELIEEQMFSDYSNY